MQIETVIFWVIDRGNCDLITIQKKIPCTPLTLWPDRKRREGENHVKSFNGWDSDRVDVKEGRERWKKGRREVGILVPAALVLQAWLTSAGPAHGCSPLPISTDGRPAAGKNTRQLRSLLLSFLLHTSHKPWPSQSNLWRVKSSQCSLPLWCMRKIEWEKQAWLNLFKRSDTLFLIVSYSRYNITVIDFSWAYKEQTVHLPLH